MQRFLTGEGRVALPHFSGAKLLAMALIVLAAAYLVWKVTQSGDQALQFAFNGLAVGAVYAVMALGFTLVYSTVWFFDLYYGAAAALGAYGVFYLRSQQAVWRSVRDRPPILEPSPGGGRRRSDSLGAKCGSQAPADRWP